MAMPTVFKSSEEFNEFTYAVSQQMKTMKLATLREAIAKAAGFRHLDAYREHLDRNQYTVVSAKKQHRLKDLVAEEQARQSDALTELGVAICMEDDMLMFQGDRYTDKGELPDRVLYIDSNDNIAHMSASDFLVGNHELEEMSAHTDAQGRSLVRGYLDITEKPMAALYAIKHFRTTQGDDWAGGKLVNALLDELFTHLTQNRQWWLDYGIHNAAIDLCGGMPLDTVDRMMGDNPMIPHESRWLDWMKDTRHPEQLDILADVYNRQGKQLHGFLMHLSAKNMLLTALCFLRGKVDDARDLDTLMDLCKAYRKEISDCMALAFFNELPVKADSLYTND